DLWVMSLARESNEAIYFFIKDDHLFGATVVRARLLGWKADPFTLHTLNTNCDQEQINDMYRHKDQLLYGMIRNELHRLVKVDDHRVVVISLMFPSEVIERYKLHHCSVWYYKS